VVKGEKEAKEVHGELSEKFPVKYMGKVSELLGAEISQVAGGVEIRLEAYFGRLLARHNDILTRPKQPLQPGLKRTGEGRALCAEEKHYYRQLVGELQYAGNYCRPDLLFAANYIGRWTEQATTADLAVAEYVMGYALHSASSVLRFKKAGDSVLTAYVDSSYDGRQGKRSTTGFIIYFAGMPVMWKSSLQSRIANSSAEAEFRAMLELANQIEWLRGLLAELGMQQKQPTSFYTDSASALNLVTNVDQQVSNALRHLCGEINIMQERIQLGFVYPHFVPGEAQVADVLTKALPFNRHQQLVRQCGMELILRK
jgi:hypothetical protein